jgi:hypothetical protein
VGILSLGGITINHFQTLSKLPLKYAIPIIALSSVLLALSVYSSWQSLVGIFAGHVQKQYSTDGSCQYIISTSESAVWACNAYTYTISQVSEYGKTYENDKRRALALRECISSSNKTFQAFTDYGRLIPNSASNSLANLNAEFRAYGRVIASAREKDIPDLEPLLATKTITAIEELRDSCKIEIER